jgi:hypothetical protein
VDRASSGVTAADRAGHPYPMAPSGGLFLAIVGVGLIAAVAFSGDTLADLRIFFVGVGLGTLALMFASKLSLGKPTRAQIGALGAAIALEVVLFNVQGRLLPRGTDESVRWMWISMIVGVHFLPMAISFGPRLLVLGFICIAIAIAGLSLPSVPGEAFLLMDAFAKLVIGLWLLSDLSRRSVLRSAA